MPVETAARKLYLVRHAYAAHADASRWPDDARRPLTAEGARRFTDAARALGHICPDVDAVLSSGYARAWETAQLLHRRAGWPAPQECVALEADRPAAAAVGVLRERDAGALALVGHEPQLSTLASLLCAGDEDTLDLELKKGAVALLELRPGSAPGAARLCWALPPKILRALARSS